MGGCRGGEKMETHVLSFGYASDYVSFVEKFSSSIEVLSVVVFEGNLIVTYKI